MKQYSNGRKGFVIVLHTMFVVLLFVNIFALQFHIREKISEGKWVSTILSVLGFFGAFITLAYITEITGQKNSGKEERKEYLIDRIPFDILLVTNAVLLILLARFVRVVRLLKFDFAGSLVVAGTFSCIIDMLFILFYLSVVRRIKEGTLFENTLVNRVRMPFLNKKKSGRPLLLCTRNAREIFSLQKAIEEISLGKLDTQLDENEFHGQQKEFARAINRIGEGMKNAVNENTKNERMKADLITNVSHDIKTPLTSIVNYVDLLKRADIKDEKALNYIRIIDEKANRLKVLTEELVEASKISSGNIKLDIQRIDFLELMYQTGGEFNERFEAKDLTIVTKLPKEPIYIDADGRQLYRVLENLYTNAAKYALEKTRVYVEMVREEDRVTLTMKNVAKNPEGLHKYSDLTDRFVRGEESRTTEGSGLGLSIAKNLTLLMKGSFQIKVEGDLFIAMVSFKIP